MAKQWKPFQPAYTPGTYTRIGVKKLSDEELVREYSRVRRDAQERLRAFSRSSDPEIRGAAVVAEKAGLYLNRAQIKAVGGRPLMEDLLIDAYRFVSAKTSSVTGFKRTREKQVNAMQAKGYDFVTSDNIREFGEFMDYFRSRKDAKAYGSDFVALAFNQAQAQNIPPEKVRYHFKFYLAQVQGWDTEVRYWAQQQGIDDASISQKFLYYFEKYKQSVSNEKRQAVIDWAMSKGKSEKAIKRRYAYYERQFRATLTPQQRDQFDYAYDLRKFKRKKRR